MLKERSGISADGVYGPKPRKPCAAFQSAHGLTVDGSSAPPRCRAAAGILRHTESSGVRRDAVKLPRHSEGEGSGDAGLGLQSELHLINRRPPSGRRQSPPSKRLPGTPRAERRRRSRSATWSVLGIP